MSDFVTDCVVEDFDIELGDVDMFEHIKVRDSKLFFKEFIEYSKDIHIDSKKWCIIMAILGCCNSVIQNEVKDDLLDLGKYNAQYQEQIRLIQDYSSGILESKREGAGALLLLEIVNSIALGINTMFEQFILQFKISNSLSLSQVMTKIRKLCDQVKAKQSKGFGANLKIDKNLDCLYMLVHPILNEAHFPFFLGLLTDSTFVFNFMVDGYLRELDYVATTDGFVKDPGDLKTISYYKREDDIDSDLFVGDFKTIFDFAKSNGFSHSSPSTDSIKSYVVNLQYFVDSILPLYLNSPLISKRYRIVTEKVEKSYIKHCHEVLQDSIYAMAVNKFDDFLVNNLDDQLLAQVVSKVKTMKAGNIKSVGKIIGLPNNWTKILTNNNLQQIMADFVEMVDFFTDDHAIEVLELSEEVVEEDDTELLSVDDINIISAELTQVHNETTQLLTNSNIVFDEKVFETLSSLKLKSVSRFMDKIHLLINSLVESKEDNLTIPSIIQYVSNPVLFDGQRFISPKRVTLFTNNEDGFLKGDLEFRVGSALRLFLRLVDGQIKVVFFGNPKYH